MRGTIALPACILMMSLTAPAAAQERSAPDLGIFGTIAGEWEGDAWMMRGPQGRIEAHQREWVMPEAGGTVITVRGLGMVGADTVHHAFAVIHRNRDNSGITMRAFTADGRWIDPEITATGSGYTWSMTDPRAGRIKYEMALSSDGAWQENGFYSRDNGATWTQFMGMTLRRKSP